MAENSNDDSITIRLLNKYYDELEAVFIKREGRDPSEENLARERATYEAAEAKEYEMATKRLLQETGVQPECRDVRRAVWTLMANAEYNSDYTTYFRRRLGPSYEPAWWIEMCKEHNKSNPFDLTRSDPPLTNTPIKGQSLDPRQTNAGRMRFSPPTSTRPRSLSTVGQPKQKPRHQRTQSQSSQASPARLQSDTTAKMARLRAKTTANITNKGPPQPPTEKPPKKIFEDLTNDSDSGSESPLQPRKSQPPITMEKLPKQLFFARTRSNGSSSINKRQPPVRPTSMRQGSMPSLLDSEDELNDVHLLDYRSPLRSSTSKDKPAAETSRPLPSPSSTQKSACTQTTEQVSDDESYPRDFSAQLSTRIHDYIEEAVGGVDDRVHRIFRDVTLKTSLYILENTPSHASLLQSINSQITTNERNARTINKSLEETLNAHDPESNSLSPKATDHCKLLDKQEKERQKALEGMLKKLERCKREKAEVLRAIGALRKDLKEQRDICNQKEIKEMRKMYSEQVKEKSSDDDGDEIVEGSNRKRKRDPETEEHMDIDMLM